MPANPTLRDILTAMSTAETPSEYTKAKADALCWIAEHGPAVVEVFGLIKADQPYRMIENAAKELEGVI